MATILIIDDDLDILRLLRRVLESQGHTVREAADGRPWSRTAPRS